MTHRAPRDAARRLIVSFVLALLAPATALVWLGLRFIEQDRGLIERQFANAARAPPTVRSPVSSSRSRPRSAASPAIPPTWQSARTTMPSS
jgi:hypothetical protein